MSNAIILFPDFEKLKTEVEKLRTELSILVLERDELLYIECKNIEMVYMLSLGSLEYKAYEIQCVIFRLKRKIELLQAKKNRQEKIVLSEIEATLDLEFEEYQKRLDAQIDKMNLALERSKGEVLSEEDNSELKQLYRSIVKALHPDLHPDLSESMMQLFRNAVLAYEKGDLNGLRIIDEMVVSPVLPDENESGMAHLAKEKERLSMLLKGIRDRIEEIKSEYPYTMKPIVESEEMTATKKAEMKDFIGQLNDVLSSFKDKVDQLLGL